MPDVFTKRKRSEVMSRIRGRGNKDTEVALAKVLRKHGITGWRRQQKLKIESKKRRAGPARPTNIQIDFIFPKQRVAVFVDGCFWHGCPRHANPVKWVGKSSMGEGQAWHTPQHPTFNTQRSTLNGEASSTLAVRERKAIYLTEETRQRSFDTLRMTTGGNRSRKAAKAQRTGKSFWREKLAANIARDRFVNRVLREQGWKVVRIWEHELRQGRRKKDESGRKRVLEKVKKVIH